MAASPETIRYWLSQMALHDDKRAFRDLFHHFYRDALRVALFHVPDPETAEELTSDVFLKLWDRRATLTEVQFLRTYLLVSVRNHCLNHLRKQQPNFTSLDAEALCVAPVATETPEQAVVWTEMQQALQQAVTSLPPRCGLIFQMVREQQLSYREVAEVLQITPKTVETQMGIALKRLSQVAQSMVETLPFLLFIFSNFFSK
jgi:RNA polymerase sigma-70 factor (family 1)